MRRERSIRTVRLPLAVLAAGCLAALPSSPLAGPDKLETPAHVRVEFAPAEVAPGGEATLRLHLEPVDGVQINRYPQVKLSLPGHAGLFGPASAAVGNPTPPPADRMDANYFDEVEPLEVALKIADTATVGRHAIEAQLVYFYCVKESGFCAPANETLSLTLEVR